METLQHVIDALPAILAGISMVIAGASLIAAATPSRRDDEILAKVRKVIDLLALNVGHARPPGKEPPA